MSGFALCGIALKQFRMFVHDGSIDRELFEMSSEHKLDVDTLKAMINAEIKKMEQGEALVTEHEVE